MKAQQPPTHPTVEATRHFLSKWDNLPKYKYQEESLTLLFRQLCPDNKELSHVLLKVSALNDFYSTNIFDTHTVARHIHGLDPDARLRAGDRALVNQLAAVVVGGKERNFYSFASKYCNHHNPEAFPIYDSYVEKMLLHFRDKDGFATFDKGELKQYQRFVDIIRAFRSHYKLDQFTLRQIDIYLWLAGKEAFGRFESKRTKGVRDGGTTAFVGGGRGPDAPTTR